MATKKISEFSPGRNDNIYLYTKGDEFSLDGKDYIGEYHYATTTPKTGPIPSPYSRLLQKVYRNADHYIYDKAFKFDVPVSRYVAPKPYVYIPDDQAYANKFDTRYFIEKIQDDKSYAIEIDILQYININKLGGIDGGLYPNAMVQWQLTGRREDILKNNELELLKASKTVPSVAYAVKNYLEFARITLG